MIADDFVARPAQGRVVMIARRVGLGDVRPDTRLRLDGFARFAQDVADEDSSQVPFGDGGVWILRRSALRIARTPRFRADVTLHTWCGGVGAGWAERRTDFDVDGTTCASMAALWVYVDLARGTPKRLPAAFHEHFGAAAGGRTVRPTLRHRAPDPRAISTPWALRAVDLDVIGHVNNAAYWAPIEDELARRGAPRVSYTEMEYRSGLDLAEPVEVAVADRPDGFACWLSVHSDVRASALVTCAP